MKRLTALAALLLTAGLFSAAPVHTDGAQAAGLYRGSQVRGFRQRNRRFRRRNRVRSFRRSRVLGFRRSRARPRVRGFVQRSPVGSFPPNIPNWAARAFRSSSNDGT